MNINELCKTAHDLAVEKGFWDCPKCKGKSMDYMCSSCGDSGKADRNVSELLMLIVSEVGEACEALRKGRKQSNLPDGEWLKDTFEDELADVVIRLGDLCGAMKINLEWQIQKKLDYNKGRPYKHGKEF